jgi:hypothetical protein
MGKALNVVMNGSFATSGCPRLRFAAARTTCTRGARSYEGALETFS